MRTILNGKKYDTTTAKKLGYHQHSYKGQFEYFHEELYQKKRTGEFFIAGEGGAMTRYSRRAGDGNSYTSGERITPLTEAQARHWAETHLSVDEFEAIFGEVEE